MNAHIISFHPGKNSRRHVIFGKSSTGEEVTYCEIRFRKSFPGKKSQKRCKNCTRELRDAGMSWRWYESNP